MVAAVDQYDLGGTGVPQRVRRRDPGKAAADDNNALPHRTRRLNDRCCPIRPSVGQHRAHGSPLFVLFVLHGFSREQSVGAIRIHRMKCGRRSARERISGRPQYCRGMQIDANRNSKTGSSAISCSCSFCSFCSFLLFLSFISQLLFNHRRHQTFDASTWGRPTRLTCVANSGLSLRWSTSPPPLF